MLRPRPRLTLHLGTVRTFRTLRQIVDSGAIFSGAYFFNKYVGGQIEVGLHSGAAVNESLGPGRPA